MRKKKMAGSLSGNNSDCRRKGNTEDQMGETCKELLTVDTGTQEVRCQLTVLSGSIGQGADDIIQQEVHAG